MSRLLTAFVLALAIPACSGGSSGGAAPPPKPATGAPIAFQVEKVTPGDRDTAAIAVKAYNFSDKTVAGYGILMRYSDKDGQPVKVKVGTPFEKDFDFTSMSGSDFKCKPKSWCTFAIDNIEIPPTAVKAEVLASSVRVLKADGMNFEEEDAWRLPGGSMDWPMSATPQ